MKNTHRASSTLVSVQTEASPISILSLCFLFDFVLSFYSPAVQPDDNQSQRSKTSLCLIHKQPIAIGSGTPSDLHLYNTSKIYTSSALIPCHSSEMRLLPAVLLPTGEKTEAGNEMCLSFTHIVLCILDDFLTVLYDLFNYNLLSPIKHWSC